MDRRRTLRKRLSKLILDSYYQKVAEPRVSSGAEVKKSAPSENASKIASFERGDHVRGAARFDGMELMRLAVVFDERKMKWPTQAIFSRRIPSAASAAERYPHRRLTTSQPELSSRINSAPRAWNSLLAPIAIDRRAPMKHCWRSFVGSFVGSPGHVGPMHRMISIGLETSWLGQPLVPRPNPENARASSVGKGARRFGADWRD